MGSDQLGDGRCLKGTSGRGVGRVAIGRLGDRAKPPLNDVELETVEENEHFGLPSELVKMIKEKGATA